MTDVDDVQTTRSPRVVEDGIIFHRTRVRTRGGAIAVLAGLGTALRSIAAILLMTDPRDLGVSVTEKPDGGLASFQPNLYLYDNYPGGIGQSAPLFQVRSRLLSMTRELISACTCDDGCPSCVGPRGETGTGGKHAALRILDEVRPYLGLEITGEIEGT